MNSFAVEGTEPPPLMEGEGRSFRVLGFNQNQRVAFVQILMRFSCTFVIFGPVIFACQIYSLSAHTCVLHAYVLMMPKSSPVRCTILALVAVTYKREQNENTLQKAPVWSRPNTLQRLSQKSFYNSRVLKRSQSRVPLCEEDVGAFIVVRSCLLSLQSQSYPCRASLLLVEQVLSLQPKSFPCRASLLLVGQVLSLQPKSFPCRASLQESET